MAGKIFGLAKWILDADNRKLNRKAKESEEAIKDVGEAADKSAQKVRGLGDAGERIDKSTEGVRKFTGALGGAVGAVTGLLGVVTALVGAMAVLYKWTQKNTQASKDASDEYSSMRDALIEMQNAVNAGDVVSKDELNTLESMRVESEKMTVEQKNQLFDKLEILRAENKVLDAQIKQREAGRASADEYQSIQSRIKAINAELSDDKPRQLEQIRHEERMRNLDDEWESSTRTNSDAFDALLTAEAVLHKARMDNIDTEEKKKAQELAERIAAEKRASEERMAAERESTIKAAQDAAEAYAKQLTRSTGDFTTRLDSILNAVRDVSRVSGRR